MADENVSLFPIIENFTNDMYVWVLDPNSSPQSQRFLLSNFIQEDRIKFAVATGTANAIIIALKSPLTSYVTGQQFKFQASGANTGPVTINVDGVGVKTIKRSDGTTLQSGDIPAGSINTIDYDGTNFQLKVPRTGSWLLNDTSILNYPATGAASFNAVDGLTNAVDLTGQDTAEIFDFITLGVLDTGRVSSGDANFIRFQNDVVDVFKVDINGQLLLPTVGITGGIVFGDGDTSIYEIEDDRLAVRVSSADRWYFGKPGTSSTVFFSAVNSGPYLNGDPGAIGYSFVGDTNTGLKRNSADDIGFYTGGIEAINIDASQTTTVTGAGFIIPVGLDAARVETQGSIRYNTTGSNFEGYDGADWQDLQGGGGGDVTKVGTPINNQVGVWTGDGTIEGTSDLSWTGTNLSISGEFAETAAANYIQNLTATSTGTTAAGFGVGISFIAEHSGGLVSTLGQIAMINNDATTQPEASFIIRLNRTGATGILELFKLDGDTAKITLGGAQSYSPEIISEASGSDVDLKLTAKGAGGVILGQSANKVGLYNTSPVLQQSHISDPAGGATVDSEARTAINSILAQMAALGIQASS